MISYCKFHQLVNTALTIAFVTAMLTNGPILMADDMTSAPAEPPAALAPVEPLPAPTRSVDQDWVGGIPLGGIGTGSVELRGDGSFREWQIFNNWGNDLTLHVTGYPGHPEYNLLNAFAAIKVNGSAYVLETHPPQGLPGVSSISYKGRFPLAHLDFGFTPVTPITVSVNAFGSFVPHEPNSSGIPAFGLFYDIKDVSSAPTTISLALSAVNPNGKECLINNEDNQTIVESLDGGSGVALCALDGNAVSIAGGDDSDNTLQAFWRSFSQGDLRSQNAGQGARIAQIVTFTLQPGQEKVERFVIGWYCPNHHENGDGVLVGQKYEAWTKSPTDSVQLFGARFNQIESGDSSWADTLTNSSWPAWVTDWLVNCQSTMVKNTWWTEDGRFMNYESVECPNGSPVHIIDLADWPVVDEFPQLELGLLREYAANEAPDGDIPEQFNFKDGPGITYPGGRELYDKNPKYVIEVFHRWRETGDRKFLDDCWPAVKKSIIYQEKFDTLGVGLPSGHSMIGTWDHWDNEYLPSYGATMWLAGLKAAEALAIVENDSDFAAHLQSEYATGLASLNQHLWNGEFYSMTADKNLNQDNLSFEESTYGDDFARLVGLGGVIPDDRALSTLRAVLKYNSAPTAYGLVVTADTSGKMVEYNGDVRAQITTCHSIPAPIALILEGNPSDVTDGLRVLKALYGLSALHPGALWNLPHHAVAATGDRNVFDFSHYLRDRAIWGLLKVLNGWSYDAPDQSVEIGPVLTPELCHGPWICSKAYGTLSQEIGSSRQTDSLTTVEGSWSLKRIEVKTAIVRKDVRSFVDGEEIKCKFSDTVSGVEVNFNSPVKLIPGTVLTIKIAGA